MTFGDKMKKTRLALNLSQTELSQMTGISQRSLYTYEQCGVLPRSSNIKKLADALQVSVPYLVNEGENEKDDAVCENLFLSNAYKDFGSQGVREAREIIERTGTLLAGGQLNEESKDIFFKSLIEVYMDSKKNAREKFTQKKYRKHRSKPSFAGPRMDDSRFPGS